MIANGTQSTYAMRPSRPYSRYVNAIIIAIGLHLLGSALLQVCVSYFNPNITARAASYLHFGFGTFGIMCVQGVLTVATRQPLFILFLVFLFKSMMPDSLSWSGPQLDFMVVQSVHKLHELLSSILPVLNALLLFVVLRRKPLR